MALDTLIAGNLGPPTPGPAPQDGRPALVLMGGGARTAYQAGVLKGLAKLLCDTPGTDTARFPFGLLLGTSAGALNAAFLASQAALGVAAFGRLTAFWQQISSAQVYRLDAPTWVRANKLVAAFTLARQVRRHRALLDTMPLVDTLHRQIDLNAVEASLELGHIHTLGVTASSYSSGEHWTFCQTAAAHPVTPWHRPGRRADMQPITIEHLMASSAIPFLFPAVPLWVDGHKEYFGDGSMRQLSPLSPAIQLGARRVLTIGVAQPQRAGLGARMGRSPDLEPTAGTIAGHAMASLFHDTLQSDVEQAQRVSRTLAALPPELARALPYAPVRVLVIQPSLSLDELARKHVDALPGGTRDTLRGLGALGGEGRELGSAAALTSYLLFEPPFVNAVMHLGEQDALAQKDELLAFFGDPAHLAVP